MRQALSRSSSALSAAVAPAAGPARIFGIRPLRAGFDGGIHLCSNESGRARMIRS
jgi:hypothetical protein